MVANCTKMRFMRNYGRLLLIMQEAPNNGFALSNIGYGLGVGMIELSIIPTVILLLCSSFLGESVRFYLLELVMSIMGLETLYSGFPTTALDWLNFFDDDDQSARDFEQMIREGVIEVNGVQTMMSINFKNMVGDVINDFIVNRTHHQFVAGEGTIQSVLVADDRSLDVLLNDICHLSLLNCHMNVLPYQLMKFWRYQHIESFRNYFPSIFINGHAIAEPLLLMEQYPFKNWLSSDLMLHFGLVDPVINAILIIDEKYNCCYCFVDSFLIVSIMK